MSVYFSEYLKNGRALNIQGLEGSSFAYIASKIWSEEKKAAVVVCSDSAAAEKLADDIGFYSQSVAPGQIVGFPEPASLPFTHIIPQTDTWIDRLKALYTIENESAPLIIAPIAGLLRKVLPKDVFYDHIENVYVGSKLDRDKFLKKLAAAGYSNSPLVEDEGEFASRGFIIDVWSPVADRPVRIELDGDVISSIRGFDPVSQRTSFSVDRVAIIPVRSVMLDDEVVAKGLALLKKRADDIGVSPVERREYAEAVRNGIYPAYTETLLPIFHPEAVFFWEYLKQDSLFFIADPAEIRQRYSSFWVELLSSYKEVKHIERAVKLEDLYMNYKGWQDILSGRPVVTANELEIFAGKETQFVKVGAHKSSPPAGVWVDGAAESSLSNFVGKIKEWLSSGLTIFVSCHTSTQADRVIDLLRWQGLAPHMTDRPFPSPSKRGGAAIFVTIGALSEGFVWPEEKIALLTEKEIFGKKRRKIPRASSLPTEAFMSYHELSDGDRLVHIQHGVGRYRGMVQLQFGSMKNDFLQLEYLGGDKLYVPAYRLNLVQKYVGAGEYSPLLDKLGGARWVNAKQKANRAVRKMAAELLRLYATRKIKKGFAFSGRDHLMEEFEAAFPYDETPDQAAAVEDVIKDMSIDHPADRLICGDVGYGKTEVAMRGTFRAAMDGKQVAVLVPTTILAFQHYETFKERFKKTPVSIELLNRFISASEKKRIVKDLAEAKTDIIIGTHRILQKDVTFSDLGLLVIDEEHRFGVRQKETIKKLKANVDVISMSATPIPRTLHVSFVGARDISVINTPPADRLSIRTYVAEFDEGLIRGAILKEIRRGGQVFFVHNRVQTIEAMKDRLRKIVPEARICVGHGQMKEHQLEKVMVAFLHKEYDVLLCTTIIESGLDIPSANTIIVNRADTFGLAQLYQLRGRVGRSSVQAYAYLLIPEESEITAIASKRLSALQRYTDLGSGFQIAMHDLEIRGAGNILGAEQSGHISAVGYELYAELLEKEIRKLKGERDVSLIDTEIQIPVEAYIPSSYVSDDGARIVLYKRMSALKEVLLIDDMAGELEDRYGEMPDVVKNLLKVIEIKIMAAGLGIESVQMSKGVFAYRFSETTKVRPEAIFKLVAKDPKHIRIKPNSILVITENQASLEDFFSRIRRHLDQFEKLTKNTS